MGLNNVMPFSTLPVGLGMHSERMERALGNVRSRMNSPVKLSKWGDETGFVQVYGFLCISSSFNGKFERLDSYYGIGVLLVKSRPCCDQSLNEKQAAIDNIGLLTPH